MKNNKLSDKEINIIKILRTNGKSYKQIAKGLGISSSTSYKYGKDVIPLGKPLISQTLDKVLPDVFQILREIKDLTDKINELLEPLIFIDMELKTTKNDF